MCLGCNMFISVLTILFEGTGGEARRGIVGRGVDRASGFSSGSAAPRGLPRPRGFRRFVCLLLVTGMVVLLRDPSGPIGFRSRSRARKTRLCSRWTLRVYSVSTAEVGYGVDECPCPSPIHHRCFVKCLKQLVDLCPRARRSVLS